MFFFFLLFGFLFLLTRKILSHITAISIRIFYFALSPILYSGTQSIGKETQILGTPSSSYDLLCQFFGHWK